MSSLLASMTWPFAGPSIPRAGMATARIQDASNEPTHVNDSAQDDLTCVQRVGRGDQRAYRVLVDRYLGGITRFALRLLHDSAEAEEVAQETFLRLWTEAKAFEPRAQPKTWLYRIARNQCIDRLRKRRSHGQEQELSDEESGDRPSGSFARKQAAERVEHALSKLPERQRAALTLVHYEGLSGAEACEVLDVSAEALESLLARGRRSLREQLRGLEVERTD